MTGDNTTYLANDSGCLLREERWLVMEEICLRMEEMRGEGVDKSRKEGQTAGACL